MRQFELLRILRAFRKEHADFLGTQEDRHLMGEIGYHQAKGEPLTLKQLFLLDIGSISTVQRRLRRLKELGLVRHRPAAGDRRAVELTLSPKCMRVFAKYGELMSAKPPPPSAVRASGEPRHLCGLCDSDEGRRNLLVSFFAQGMKRGDRCVLVAPLATQNEVLEGLPNRRRASEQVHVSLGHDSGDAQLAFCATHAREARRAGRNLCLGGDVAWAISRRVGIDELLAFETRLETLARKIKAAVLCVYDTRHFSGSDFLHAMKCHRDHLRHPVLLG